MKKRKRLTTPRTQWVDLSYERSTTRSLWMLEGMYAATSWRLEVRTPNALYLYITLLHEVYLHGFPTTRREIDIWR